MMELLGDLFGDFDSAGNQNRPAIVLDQVSGCTRRRAGDAA